jgi:PERQ amino acid-rich with GYF domain-containing protein
MDGSSVAESTGPFSPTSVQDGFFANRPGFHAARTSQGSPLINGQPALGVNEFPTTPQREGSRLFGRGESFDAGHNVNAFANGSIPYPSNSQPFGQAQIPVGSQYDTRSVHSFASITERQQVSTPLTPQRTVPQPFMGSPVVSSPWPPQDATTIRRPDPFGPDYPTSRNTIVQRTITPAQSFPAQVQAQQPITATNDQSPWYAASQGAVGEGWTFDNLTTANLGQHNKQQEEEARQHETEPASIADSPVVQDVPIPETVSHKESSPEPAVPTPVEPSTTTSKRRRKTTVPASTASASAPTIQPASAKSGVSAPAIIPKPSSPAPQLSPLAEAGRPVWGTVDDEKKPAAPTLGLREIQEMEAKKTESRKAAERERERVARAAASQAASEEVQTLSWGLPTSQVGTRASTAPKEAAVPQLNTPTTNSAAPVWTTSTKASVVKKTMKEIQEEEEKRKKQAAKEKETVAAAARRAYADSTTKASAPAQGGAWTTVGASGKTASTVTSPPARPAVSTAASTKTVSGIPSTPALSTASVVSRATASPAPARSPVATASVRLAPATPKDEPPIAPSHDFLKWMTDSLKGLNNSVNSESGFLSIPAQF